MIAVRFTRDWIGNDGFTGRRGQIITPPRPVAKLLVGRQIAEYVEQPSGTPIQPQTHDGTDNGAGDASGAERRSKGNTKRRRRRTKQSD